MNLHIAMQEEYPGFLQAPSHFSIKENRLPIFSEPQHILWQETYCSLCLFFIGLVTGGNPNADITINKLHSGQSTWSH
jgi:hypothetical protein